jgi:hypothetical protein
VSSRPISGVSCYTDPAPNRMFCMFLAQNLLPIVGMAHEFFQGLLTVGF